MLPMSNVHQGGCACDQSRYEVTDKPVKTDDDRFDGKKK